jgi:hypothetical protein
LYGDESGDYTGATRLRDGRVHIEPHTHRRRKTHLTGVRSAKRRLWKIFQQDDNHGYDPRNRPLYSGQAKRKARLTQPYMFLPRACPEFHVLPLKKPTGELCGVFSVEFDLNTLSEFVSALSLSEHLRSSCSRPTKCYRASEPTQPGRQGREGQRGDAHPG